MDYGAELELFRINLNKNNQDAADRRSLSADQTMMSGEVRINGGGDSMISIPFACRFTEKPLFFFGGELVDETNLSAGSYPTISAMVCGWTTEEKTQFMKTQDYISSTQEGVNFAPNTRWFTGANIAVVTTGTPETKFVLHWHFIGNAYSATGNVS